MPTDPASVFVTLHEIEPLRDAFGPRLGDELVATVAERLRRVAGGDDRVASVGDGFVVLCEGPSVPGSVAAALAVPVTVQGWEIPVQATFRVTTGAGPLRRHERAPSGEEGLVETIELVPQGRSGPAGRQQGVGQQRVGLEVA
jgi:GGDEF domain-containing protein